MDSVQALISNSATSSSHFGEILKNYLIFFYNFKNWILYLKISKLK